jgi:hypothetical protein
MAQNLDKKSRKSSEWDPVGLVFWELNVSMPLNRSTTLPSWGVGPDDVGPVPRLMVLDIYV